MSKKLMLINDETGETKEIKKREKNKSDYKGFYQLNKEYTANLVGITLENPTAAALLLFIINNVNNYNAVVCQYDDFINALNKSKSTIQRSIKYLKDNGFLMTKKINSSTAYILNPEFVWSSWDINKQYSSFPTNVHIKQTEYSDQIKKYSSEIKKNIIAK